jgi:Ca2+-binding RTX toxin-like protein
MSAPTGLKLDGTEVDGAGPHASIVEFAKSGLRIGVLTAVDADSADSFTFELLDDASGRFFIDGDHLRVSAGAVLDAGNDGAYTVTVRITDSDNNTFDQDLTIGLIDAEFQVVIPGTAGDDELFTPNANQQIMTPGAGNDTLHADGDIVTYSGNRSDYGITVETIGGGGGYGYGGPPPEIRYHITDLRPGGPDGTDLVIDPSRFRFADGEYAEEQLFDSRPSALTLNGRALEFDTYIVENVPVGTVIGTLGGRDIDSTSFTYEISDQDGRPGSSIFLENVSLFEIVGDQLVTTGPINFEQFTEFFVDIDFADESGNTWSDTIRITVDNANDAPEFGNLGGLDRISENADTSAGIEIGNIFIFDDGVGTNNLFLTGPDAGLLEIVAGPFGPEVHLKAGAILDFESNPTLDFTLNADDPSLPGSPDGTFDVSIPVLFVPINGTPNDDLLTGSPLADTINGLGGNDVIFAQGDDRLNGGTGNDNLVAGADRTILSGASGEDVYSLLGSTTAALTTIADSLGIDTIEATHARSGLVLDLSTGTGHVGQQQIVIETHAATGGLELMFAQDVSGSAQNHVTVMQSLIADVIATVQSFDADARFGVGSFVDKPFFPFGVFSEGDYIYRTDAALTTGGAPIAAVYDLLASEYEGDEAGGDSLEGQLEALQQIALRTAEIGWSATDTTKVVVLFTDAPFHEGGDVQDYFDTLGGPGIGDLPPRAEPNNNDTVFDLDEEYPAIQQVRDLLFSQNIIPVFAVPDFGTGVPDQYQALVDLFGFGAVVPMFANSADVLSAIQSALDFATAGTTIENVTGTRFNDIITGNAADNRLIGAAGEDTLNGGDGDDTLNGGLGDDVMTGGAGNDTFVINSAGDQVIELAGGGIDRIITNVDTSLAGTEIENLTAAAGADGLILTGNDADNRIVGRDGADVIDGGIGNDILSGGLGIDTLTGGLGNDKLFGGEDGDFLTGGEGADILTGGDGNDAFIYQSVQDSTTAPAGRDRIDDFLIGSDKIDLEQIDAVLGGGDNAFNYVGTAAFQNAGDLRAVATGNNTVVSGDIDGNGVADFQIVVRGPLTLSATDFVL